MPTMMKKTMMISGLAALGLLSCIKDEAPDAYLGVTLQQGQYRAGEPVTFKFEGDPDNIVFWSGENGHRYEYRERTQADCDIFLDFTSYVRNGDAGKNLKICISTDFSGVYDEANVKAATWTDISDRFRFSPGTDNYPSGELQLDEYLQTASAGGNFFIAFRYTGGSNQWIVRSTDVDRQTPENVRSSMADMSSIGWQFVDCGNPDASWNFDGSRLYFDWNTGAGTDNDDWAISGPLNASSVDPDTGTALKSLSTTMDEFTYTYNEPGIYKAVFATSSVWYSDSKYSLTEVEVKVVGEGSGADLPPVLTVTPDKTACAAGEEVNFTLSGEGVSNIMFWSGEAGHEFQYRESYDRFGDIAVNFTSFVRYGVIYDNLKFLVSKDFTGVYDTENVSDATWTDLSEHLTFSAGADRTESGEITLNQYLGEEQGNENPDADIYMAFHYTDNAENNVNRQNNWIIRTFNVDAISAAGVRSSLAAMSSMGWQAVDYANEDASWTITSNQILIDGKNGAPNDDWVISKAFKRQSGPDTGESVALGSFSHTFSTAGTYNIVFDWFDGMSWKQTNLTIIVE